MALSQECVLSFLLDRGGKVKNLDFLDHFKSRINSADPAEKQHNRDLFKKLVNSVAVVKTIDETKFVVVKKRYLDFIKDAPHCVSPQGNLDDSTKNGTFSYPSPHCSQSVLPTFSDFQNNNTTCALNLNDDVCDNSFNACAQSEGPKSPRSASCVDATTLRVLNIPGHPANRAGKAEAVFAVVAVRSPPSTSAALKNDPCQKTTGMSTLVTKVSPTKPHSSASAPARKSNDALFGWSDETQPPCRPERPHPSKPSKQGEGTKYSECVPLDPAAHEWLVKCAAGLWKQVYALLLQDIHLIMRKDFMSGFTILHWAAKEGNSDIIRKTMDLARKRDAFINVNCKAHGGYTPLHVAAIHGHATVMFLLVQGYGAKVNVRDNDGKRAIHYVCKNVPAEVRALLGAWPHCKHREKTDEGDYINKSRNTISKRFHSHKEKKHKLAKKYAQDW